MGGAATESLASSRKPSPRETEKGTEGRKEGVGMVAAGGAGLNINPRGRPGHAPVLVRFHLNSRNHAAVVARLSQTVPAKTEKRACERTKSRPRGEREVTKPDDGSESTTTRWLVSDKRAIDDNVVVVVVNVDVLPVVASRARHIRTCCRGRCITELHRFFDALANTTDTNDPRPTADLKVRGCVNDMECRFEPE